MYYLKTKASSILTFIAQTSSYFKRGLVGPAPDFFKRRYLTRNKNLGNAAWIETGTFTGKTTEYLLKHCDYVVTIEPSVYLYKKVHSRLKSSKVLILNGTSEDKLQEAIDNIASKHYDSINFWLDGHFSSGVTFKGKQVCPLLSELTMIEKNIQSKKIIDTEINIYIDDLRLICGATHKYKRESEGYPDLSEVLHHPLVARSRLAINIDILHLNLST